MKQKKEGMRPSKALAASGALRVNRVGPILTPDFSRVLLRPFFPVKKEIAQRIINEVLRMSDKSAEKMLKQILNDFADRHEEVEQTLYIRFAQIPSRYPGIEMNTSRTKQALIGSYFTHEYSPESAALFNPSIVAHPDQSNLTDGALRFILSLRATGEGHISSITFRTGIISPEHRITVTPPASFITEPKPVSNPLFLKELFTRKLEEAGLHNHFCRRVLDQLPDEFSTEELKQSLSDVRTKMTTVDIIADRAIGGILLLAESNTEVHFKPESALSERVLFPLVPSQSNGIEDARFVAFTDDDGSVIYYATYTAYDGKIILPQLLETEDFIHFKFITLNGPAIQNKGMSLFPIKIDGKYVMLSRQDDENIFIMRSENIHFWQQPKKILKPKEPWELFKIGTCGSPIETKSGWLVLSHGVGPMRKYCISAFLLDLDNPEKVIGRLRTPLLSPNEAEREGYVPNVVYTCGALIHQGHLIIPYAASDYFSSFATVSIQEIVSAME